MLLNEPVHNLARGAQGAQRPGLVLAHQARVARHVGGEDRCQTPFDPLFLLRRHRSPLPLRHRAAEGGWVQGLDSGVPCPSPRAENGPRLPKHGDAAPARRGKICWSYRRQIRPLLRWDDLIPTMESALAAFSEGRVIQPVRNMITIEEGRRYLGVMPAVAEAAMGLKLVSFYPGNAPSLSPSRNALTTCGRRTSSVTRRRP